jgi:hypothetical protein
MILVRKHFLGNDTRHLNFNFKTKNWDMIFIVPVKSSVKIVKTFFENFNNTINILLEQGICQRLVTKYLQ